MNNTILDFLTSKLNSEQLLATLHTTGPSLILAGAGSGKTRVLTYKIANLIYGHGVHPRNILAVTFTNKASNEMKERVQKIQEEIQELSNQNSHSDVSPLIRGGGEAGGVGQQELDFDALLGGSDQISNLQSQNSSQSSFKSYKPSDFFRIGTFHSVFLKILKQDIDKMGMNYDKNFGIYDVSDSNAVAKKVLKELNLNEMIELNEMKGTISRWKNEGWLPEQAGLHCESRQEEHIFKAYQGYQKSLEQANMLDFDDLLLLTKELFEKNPATLSKRQQHFQYFLVDEAQDTNAIQFTLMKMLAPKGSNITFIGDDYQSIYRWRGALMEQFLNIKSIRPTIETFKLQTNYRSLPHIVEAGNAIIKQNKKQYEKEIVSHRIKPGTEIKEELLQKREIIKQVAKVYGLENYKEKDEGILKNSEIGGLVNRYKYRKLDELEINSIIHEICNKIEDFFIYLKLSKNEILITYIPSSKNLPINICIELKNRGYAIIDNLINKNNDITVKGLTIENAIDIVNKKYFISNTIQIDINKTLIIIDDVIGYGSTCGFVLEKILEINNINCNIIFLGLAKNTFQKFSPYIQNENITIII